MAIKSLVNMQERRNYLDDEKRDYTNLTGKSIRYQINDIIQTLIKLPIAGEFFALFISIGIPIIIIAICLGALGYAETHPISMLLKALGVIGWNFLLIKQVNTKILLPIIPIPIWVFGIIMLMVELIKNYSSLWALFIAR